MTRFNAWFAAVTMTLLLWHECGEDIGVFCYRIGLGAFTAMRSRALVPVPARNAAENPAARNHNECSTPSFTFSAHSTVRKDSGN
jgi:hypothetical protein